MWRRWVLDLFGCCPWRQCLKEAVAYILKMYWDHCVYYFMEDDAIVLLNFGDISLSRIPCAYGCAVKALHARPFPWHVDDNFWGSVIAWASQPCFVFSGWFCISAAWTPRPFDLDNYTNANCLCPATATGGKCIAGSYCPTGSPEPLPCRPGFYCNAPG